MAEWSKALRLGSLEVFRSPQGRGFEPHSRHFTFALFTELPAAFFRSKNEEERSRGAGNRKESQVQPQSYQIGRVGRRENGFSRFSVRTGANVFCSSLSHTVCLVHLIRATKELHLGAHHNPVISLSSLAAPCLSLRKGSHS